MSEMERQAEPQKLWIVGLTKDDDPDRDWNFIGVFDSKDKAEAACRTANHWIGPAKMNEDTGDQTVEWEGAYWPKEAVK